MKQMISIWILTPAIVFGVMACRGAEERTSPILEETQHDEKHVSEATEVASSRDVADRLRKLLMEKLGDRMGDLQISFRDSTLALSGWCDSEETKRVALNLAENVHGVQKVDAAHLTVKAPKAEVDTSKPRVYTVKPNDWLSKIAKRYYGDAMNYTVIFEANRETIENADLIYPGQSVRIPELE